MMCWTVRLLAVDRLCAVRSAAPADIPVLNGVLPLAARPAIDEDVWAAVEVPSAWTTDAVVPLNFVRPT